MIPASRKRQTSDTEKGAVAVGGLGEEGINSRAQRMLRAVRILRDPMMVGPCPYTKKMDPTKTESS